MVIGANNSQLDKQTAYYNSGNNNNLKLQVKYKTSTTNSVDEKGRNVKTIRSKPYVETDKNNIPSSLTFAAFLLNNNPNSTLSLNKNVTGESVFDQFNNASTEGLPKSATDCINPGDDKVTRMEFAGVLNGYKNNAEKEATKQNTRNNNVASVNMDVDDYKSIKKTYDFIAGDDGQIQKNEFTDFYNNLFKDVKENKDGTKTIPKSKIDCLF